MVVLRIFGWIVVVIGLLLLLTLIIQVANGRNRLDGAAAFTGVLWILLTAGGYGLTRVGRGAR